MPEVKFKLKSNGEHAIGQGVFGVPTLIVDGHLFWGFDSTSLITDFLANPRLFDSSPMKRIEFLPGDEKGNY